MKSLEAMSIRFINGKLSVLDQTLLPMVERWIDIANPGEMIAAIRSLQVRGAPLIGVAAALSLASWAQSAETNLDQTTEQIEKLRAARPTAVNLMNALDRLKKQLALKDWQAGLLAEAEKIFFEDIELCEQIAANGAKLIEKGEQILTHCNTGGLATAGTGTALGIIQKAHLQNKGIHVFVDETRPLLQGGRLTTYELAKLGVPHTLICDNMAATLMVQGKVSKVIVGCDRIARNGDFANKVGTYSLAVLCHHHRIPFYVAGPYTTVDLSCASGAEIPVEQRAGEEVMGAKGDLGYVRWAPPLTKVYNPAFDVTPAAFVTRWILDTGVFSRDEINNGALSLRS